LLLTNRQTFLLVRLSAAESKDFYANRSDLFITMSLPVLRLLTGTKPDSREPEFIRTQRKEIVS